MCGPGVGVSGLLILDRFVHGLLSSLPLFGGVLGFPHDRSCCMIHPLVLDMFWGWGRVIVDDYNFFRRAVLVEFVPVWPSFSFS